MKYNVLLVALIMFLTAFSLFSQQEKQRVVVLSFKPINVDKNLTDAVAEIFITSLVGTNKFSVIERSQLDSIFNEMNLTRSDEFDDSQIVEIGRLARAEIAFVGSVTKLGNTYTVNTRAIQISTGSVILGERANASSESDITNAIDKIISSFNPEKAAASQRTSEETRKVSEERKRTDNSDVLKEKFQKRRNSGIGLLVSGGLLSGLLIPGSYLFWLADDMEYSYDYDYTLDTAMIDTFRTLGTLFVLTGVVGVILFIVGIPVLASSIGLWVKWKNSAKTSYYISPLLDTQGNDVRMGFSLSF